MKPLMVAPPPLPSHLEPKKKLDPQPGQEEFYRRPDNWPGRGYLVRYVGEAIHKAQETPLNIRHDVLIERRVIGRVLGKGGRDLEAMQLCSGAEIYIIDKYPPPGEGDDHRLLVCIGRPDQVRLATEKIDQVLQRAREELPPLPPPLTSGWRPVPSVGPTDDDGNQGWISVPRGEKRGRDDDDGYGGRGDDRDFGPPGPSSGPGDYGPPGDYVPGPAPRAAPPPPPGYDGGGRPPLAPPPPPGWRGS